KLKSKAIVADLIFHPLVVKARHKTGVNVLYANGSAQWVSVDYLNKNAVFPGALGGFFLQGAWKNMPPDPDWSYQVPGIGPNNDMMLNEALPPTNPYFAPNGVWSTLDKASGSQIK